MKKFSFLALLLIVSGLGLNAQDAVIPKTIIAPKNMNILYKGIDNPISIAVEGIADEYIVAEVSNGKGEIRKIGRGDYIIKVDHGTIEETITIDSETKEGITVQKDTTIVRDNNRIDIRLYAQIGNKKNYLCNENFIVIDIEKPKVVIGNLEGGLVEKEYLLRNPFLRTKVSDIYYPLNFDVEEFMIVFATGKKNNAEPPFFSKNNWFSPDAIEKIKSLKQGDKVYIEGIRVSMNGVITPAENPVMIFTIK